MVKFIKIGTHIINTDQIININLAPKQTGSVEIQFINGQSRNYGEYSRELKAYFSGEDVSTQRIGNTGNMVELMKFDE
jgi:hypothetical protein